MSAKTGVAVRVRQIAWESAGEHMLVLSRKVDQGIVIQGGIVIRILEVSGDRVKVGISAPREISILREELCEEVHRENLEAKATSDQARTALASLNKTLVKT